MKISEQFYSLQGEGVYTGTPSYFIRFFSCSLQCQGFGQKNPADESTWVQPWKTIDISEVKSIEDLPQEIYEYGCDSVYSWSAKFKHLQKDMTVNDVIEKMRADMGEINFMRLLHGQIHIIFTGGEPLMKANQKYITEILDALNKIFMSMLPVGRCNPSFMNLRAPLNITFETNGTQPLTKEFVDFFDDKNYNILFSVSPKLLHTSGEHPDKAIKPDIIKTYKRSMPNSYRTKMIGKFVLTSSPESKQEFLNIMHGDLRFVFDQIYIMPEGPNKSRIEDISTDLAEFALEHGFSFSDRLHARLWDNKIGV